MGGIDLKRHLIPDPSPVQPVPWRGRHELILPNKHNMLRDETNTIVKYSNEPKMVLNPIKTKVMIFNPLPKYDFLPLISIKSGKSIWVVKQHKILGQIIRSDLRTISNTEAICKKAFKRMWIIRRLKNLGYPNKELLTVLREQIVSTCEVGVAWWGPMLTKQESNMLERVLKTGLHIMFQKKYVSLEMHKI